jgi:hypothetical protein
VLVAYESLDPALKKELPITRSNTGELAVKFTRHEEAKTNTMFAGTHARGGANSLLWVSEWGVIQAGDFSRALCRRSAMACALWRRHGRAGATGTCGVVGVPLLS